MIMYTTCCLNYKFIDYIFSSFPFSAFQLLMATSLNLATKDQKKYVWKRCRANDFGKMQNFRFLVYYNKYVEKYHHYIMINDHIFDVIISYFWLYYKSNINMFVKL